MRLIDREFERIVVRARRAPHLARQIFRPRLVGRCVQRISGRPDLKNYRIESELHRAIEHLEQLLLLFARRQPRFRWPVDVLDRCYPGRSEFAPNWWRRCQIRYRAYRGLAACSVETGEHEK